LKTTDKQISEAIAAALLAANLGNVEPTRDAIARTASSKLNGKFKNRANVIAQTETQFAAEQSKFNESSALATATTLTVGGIALANFNLVKVWNTILDERTRLSHATADGQVRKRSEAFRVQGESLMFPRDDSMGAGPSNIINCRCSAQYTTGLEPTVL
jgi:uncharacterized protein with gpF-like domain